MTEIKRFRMGYFADEHAKLYDHPDGEFVTFEDHEAALRSAARTGADVATDCFSILKAIDHTLSVHGHLDAGTPLHERVEIAIETIAALPAPGGITTGWQPIETAPKDGAVILVRRDNGCGDDHDVVWWCASHDEGYPWLSEFNAYAEDRWDYWMPLPPAPTITCKSKSEEPRS